jgi:hypothetical protein
VVKLAGAQATRIRRWSHRDKGFPSGIVFAGPGSRADHATLDPKYDIGSYTHDFPPSKRQDSDREATDVDT